MAKPRELRRRIKSVENTRQITKTMEMVATSRLKRAQERVVSARPYAAALAEVLGNLYSPDLAELFPLLRRPPGKSGRAVILLITSNRGLCGAFNGNLIRKARDRLSSLEESGTDVELHCIGKKGIGYFRYVGRELAGARDDIGDRPKAEHAVEVMAPLMERFEAGEIDSVEAIFAKFDSPISTPPEILPILPVDPGSTQPARGRYNFLLRPSAMEIVGAILPLYVHNSMYRALVETAASEQGARRTAMKNATDNAGEMIDNLRRVYNRARQGQITQEIAEIVGGAEALKG